MIELSWPQVSARRLARAGLGSPGAGNAGPAEAVAAMCGAHAQVMSAAELSVGLRLGGATRAHVRVALDGGRSLVKTYGPRGTVHLLPARDLPMWVSALSSVPPGHRLPPPSLRMTAEQTDQVVAAVREALTGAELTIDELSDVVVAATGPWAGDLVMPAFQGMWPRWRQAMALAAHRGALVFGAGRGRKVTYTAPPAVQPTAPPAVQPTVRPTMQPNMQPAAQPSVPALADGLGMLVRSYLTAYGPATPEQFAQWAGGPVRWAAAAFAGAGLEEVRFEGRPAWVVAGDTDFSEEAPRGVRLLPYFDAYVVAGRPRDLLYPGAAAERALAGGQAGNYPVLLVDGVVSGVWHQRRSGSKIDITVEPLHDLAPARLRELDEQVERVGEVLEARPRLTVGPVTVGPHA